MPHRFLAGLALCAGTGLAWAHHAPGHDEPAAANHSHHGHGHAPATAASHPAQGVSVTDCWIRGMPQQLPSAGYFTVRNESGAPVRLTGVATEAFGQTMLHQTVTKDGMARMQHTDAVEIPAGGSVEFAPGGYHAMLEKPAAALVPGQSVAMTFSFGEAGQLAATCAVREPSSLGAH